MSFVPNFAQQISLFDKLAFSFQKEAENDREVLGSVVL